MKNEILLWTQTSTLLYFFSRKCICFIALSYSDRLHQFFRISLAVQPLPIVLGYEVFTYNKIMIHCLKILDFCLWIQLYLGRLWTLDLLLFVFFRFLLVFLRFFMFLMLFMCLFMRLFMMSVIFWSYGCHFGLFLFSHVLLFLLCVNVKNLELIRVVLRKVVLSVGFGRFHCCRFFLLVTFLVFVLLFLVSTTRLLLFPILINSRPLFLFLLIFIFFFILFVIYFFLLLICIIENLINFGCIKHEFCNHLMVWYIFSKKVVIQRVNILDYRFFLV